MAEQGCLLEASALGKSQVHCFLPTWAKIHIGKARTRSRSFSQSTHRLGARLPPFNFNLRGSNSQLQANSEFPIQWGNWGDSNWKNASPVKGTGQTYLILEPSVLELNPPQREALTQYQIDFSETVGRRIVPPI